MWHVQEERWKEMSAVKTVTLSMGASSAAREVRGTVSFDEALTRHVTSDQETSSRLKRDWMVR